MRLNDTERLKNGIFWSLFLNLLSRFGGFIPDLGHTGIVPMHTVYFFISEIGNILCTIFGIASFLNQNLLRISVAVFSYFFTYNVLIVLLLFYLYFVNEIENTTGRYTLLILILHLILGIFYFIVIMKKWKSGMKRI
jgi:hypothetical protein